MTSLYSKNVLLIEDDDLVATSIASVVRSRGYVVTPFRSAEELIAQFVSEPVGCMIIDIDMGPSKMTGLELLRWMRSRRWTIPVIVLSGKVTVSEAVEAMKETVIDIISKPPLVPRLMAAVENSLSGSNSAARQNVAKLRSHLQSLNGTEREVLSMLLAGSSNKVVASRLDLGLRSAVRYRKAILDTFGFSTIPELASALGTAGISLTELAAPPEFTPGFPKPQRAEIQNQLRVLKNSLARVDQNCADALFKAILNAGVELERIANHPHLAVPDNPPSVMVLSEDPHIGRLLRDLFRAHSFDAEACISVSEAAELKFGHAAPAAKYLIAIESDTITADQLRWLKRTYGNNARVALISVDPKAAQDTDDTNFVRFSLLSGQALVRFVLDDLTKNA